MQHKPKNNSRYLSYINHKRGPRTSRTLARHYHFVIPPLKTLSLPRFQERACRALADIVAFVYRGEQKIIKETRLPKNNTPPHQDFRSDYLCTSWPLRAVLECTPVLPHIWARVGGPMLGLSKLNSHYTHNNLFIFVTVQKLDPLPPSEEHNSGYLLHLRLDRRRRCIERMTHVAQTCTLLCCCCCRPWQRSNTDTRVCSI